MEKKQIIMKKISILFLIFILAAACSQKEKAKISIQIQGLGKKTVIFQEQQVDGVKTIDTLSFNGSGKLKYSLKLSQPGFYNLNIPGCSDIYMVLSPNDKLKITGSEKEGKITGLKITGSPDSEKLNTLYDSLFATREILKSIQKKYYSVQEETEKESIGAEYLSVLDNYRKFSMQFVLDNLTSLISVAALYQEVGPDEFVFGRKRDLQFFKLATDSLSKYYPKHRHVLALQRNFKQMMESLQLERIITNVETVKEGLPNLELPGLNGTNISLESMKERYVLLNFWQPADEVSSQIFPDINSTFKKYHSKGFGIYNVYLGKSTSTWNQIINYEEIGNWVNVADTSFPYSKTRMLYNVVSIPSNYLIDFKEKAILAKDLNPKQLNQILSELAN
jgi:hypothetical protein